MESRKFPAFFKPFLAKDRERRIRIPLFFSKFMEGRMPPSGFLRDRNNKLWHVKIAHIGDDYCFEGGWPKFVKENNVQLGDCLVFEYNGNYCFDVKVFGKTACEKDFDVDVGNFKGKEEDMEEEDMEEEDEEEIELIEEDDDEEIEVEEEEESEENSDSESDEVEELWEVRKRKLNNKEKRCTGWMRNSKRVNEDSDDDDQTIFDLGIIDRPKNAYFVTKLNPKRKSDLCVPMNVMKDFNLKLPKEMEICDEDGRKWCAIVKEWNDGRTYLTKGWRAFCTWNNVKRNDMCICEFVPGNGGSKIRLQIRIVRANP